MLPPTIAIDTELLFAGTSWEEPWGEKEIAAFRYGESRRDIMVKK